MPRLVTFPTTSIPATSLVVNTSATLPAAVDFLRHGCPTTLHFSTELDDGSWVVEVRRPDQSGPALPVPRRGAPTAWRASAPGRRAAPVRTVPAVADASATRRLPRPLPRRARPPDPLPLPRRRMADRGPAERLRRSPGQRRDAQRRPPAHRSAPGSDDVARHRGRADRAAHRSLQPGVARATPTGAVHRAGGDRTPGELDPGRRPAGLAVGTTVVRALESATAGDRVVPTSGWTSLVLGPDRPARVVDGLLTGLHEPEASHLHLLEAVAGRALVDAAYAEVTRPDGPAYLWHEFGDSMLLLPR